MRIISGIARGTKLYTLDNNNTRPTLDRVKESLFSIIQDELKDAIVLDLFSGSGALALEAISRGAKKAILCDNSQKATEIINKNIIKTHFEKETYVICKDYKKCLQNIKEKIDVIFIDPPYEKNIAVEALKIIENNNILSKDGLIVLETDNLPREQEQISDLKKLYISDLRLYGRVKLIFLNYREG